MISIKPLEPDVKIEKLPHFILKVPTYVILKYIIGCINKLIFFLLQMFKTNRELNIDSEDLSKIDLSCISNDWLDNLYPFQKTGIQ